MKRYNILAILLVIAGLSACSAKKAELPEPAALFEQIQQAVSLTEMAEVADELLEANTGIAASEYSSAVYYIPMQSVEPDEIIIIRAVDDSAASDIQEKLESYLSYREEAAKIYLTEYMPVLQAGKIHRDGLTVSLIISEQAAEIVRVYDN